MGASLFERSGRVKDCLPDLRQFRPRFIGNVVRFAREAIPVSAVCVVPFNLVQYGVNPVGGRVALILLREAMGGFPLSRQGEVDGL